MTFKEFRCFVLNAIGIVKADLDELEYVAEKANSSLASTSSSTTTQTTKRPDDITDCDPLKIDLSRCTIPMAMVCFSIIDIIGQWLNEKEDDDFGLAANNFFTHIANSGDLKNDEAIKKFKEQFRHGIMHSFFAKSGYSVTYLTFESNSLFVDIDKRGATLDVRYLVKMVRKGMENLEDILKDENSEMSKNLHKGFERWISKQ